MFDVLYEFQYNVGTMRFATFWRYCIKHLTNIMSDTNNFFIYHSLYFEEKQKYQCRKFKKRTYFSLMHTRPQHISKVYHYWRGVCLLEFPPNYVYLYSLTEKYNNNYVSSLVTPW